MSFRFCFKSLDRQEHDLFRKLLKLYASQHFASDIKPEPALTIASVMPMEQTTCAPPGSIHRQIRRRLDLQIILFKLNFCPACQSVRPAFSSFENPGASSRVWLPHSGPSLAGLCEAELPRKNHIRGQSEQHRFTVGKYFHLRNRNGRNHNRPSHRPVLPAQVSHPRATKASVRIG